MGHHGLKTGQKHLFEHPKWSRNKFGKNDSGPFLDPQMTHVTRHLRVPIRSLERGMARETDIHMMNNHLWSLSSGFYTQVVRPTTSLWVQNTAKLALKSTPFAYFFKLHVLATCFLAMNCIGHPCGVE